MQSQREGLLHVKAVCSVKLSLDIYPSIYLLLRLQILYIENKL